MLKFQDNNTTTIQTFEDLILIVYVMIDDLYKQFVPASVSHRRNILVAKLSDPEIITISICGELAGIDSENAWYSFVKRNYLHLFPKLCSKDTLQQDKEGTPSRHGVSFSKTAVSMFPPVQSLLCRGQLSAPCL
jgi:hypothetical protein